MSKKRTLIVTKKSRNVRPLVIIIGDGETEESYVERLKELDYFSNVHLKFEKGNEDSFETKMKEHAGIHRVLVIIDVDGTQPRTKKGRKIKRLIDIKSYSKQVFFNNCSFETWLLNHRNPFLKPMITQKQYDPYIDTCFGVKSWANNKDKRNRENITKQIDSKSIDCAVKNIKIISKNPFDNPSSNMDKWVAVIKKIK